MINFDSDCQLEYQESKQIQHQIRKLRLVTVSLFSICLLFFCCILACGVYIFNFKRTAIISVDQETQISSIVEKGVSDLRQNISSVEKGVNNLGQNISSVEKGVSDLRQNISTGLSAQAARSKEIVEMINEGKISKSLTMVSLKQKDLCLDTMHKKENERVYLHRCHYKGHNQEWQFTIYDELKNRESCITFDNVTNSILIELCNGSAMQKWNIDNGLVRNPEYDICLQSKVEDILSANCNPAESNQIFKLDVLYTIDRYCKFKQGSYVLPNDGQQWTITSNGYILQDTLCLKFEKLDSYHVGMCGNITTAKWEFTANGQLKNSNLNVCVEQENNNAVFKECDLNSKSQRWYCI